MAPDGGQQTLLDGAGNVVAPLDVPDDTADDDDLQLDLLPPVPNVDVHLHSDLEAAAQLGGTDVEVTLAWLEQVVGVCRQTSSRRVYFNADRLDRLVGPVAPAQVSMDAAAQAVAHAIWAAKVGWKPLRVRRDGHRLVVSSARRWPSYASVADVPWTAVTCLLRLKVPLDVDPDARRLMMRRVAASGQKVGVARLAGSSVRIDSGFPSLLEQMGLPALQYVGPPGTGTYRMPLLAASVLLARDEVEVPPRLAAQIKYAARRPKPVATPESAPFELKAFQKRDVADALKRLEITGGAMIAAEMGCGKTVMACTVATITDAWPALVVAPLSAFSSWERELAGFGRTAWICTDPKEATAARLAALDVDAVVVSYDRLANMPELFEGVGWRIIIADEIQRIRNASSGRSRGMRRLASAAPQRLGLSGTPMMNRLSDLLPQGAFLLPGEWRPRTTMKDLSDIYAGDDPVGSAAAHLATLMVRRRTEDTGVKMVGKDVHRVRVELSEQQKATMARLQEQAAADADKLGNRIHVFSLLSKLRRIQDSPPAEGVMEGGNPKVDTVVDLVVDYVGSGRKMCVFTVDRISHADILSQLAGQGIECVAIDGGVSPEDRIAVEKRFVSDPDVKVVVCTVKSSSEGVSFSKAAQGLVLHSSTYSPMELAQTEARVHRLDSIGDVDIFYVHATWEGQSTLDDRILEILNAKKKIIHRVIDGVEDWAPEENDLSPEELGYLLTGQ